MNRWRITVRGDDPTTELRGYIDGSVERLESLAFALKPFGLVIASPAEHDYDPFAEASA